MKSHLRALATRLPVTERIIIPYCDCGQLMDVWYPDDPGNAVENGVLPVYVCKRCMIAKPCGKVTLGFDARSVVNTNWLKRDDVPYVSKSTGQLPNCWNCHYWIDSRVPEFCPKVIEDGRDDLYACAYCGKTMKDYPRRQERYKKPNIICTPLC